MALTLSLIDGRILIGSDIRKTEVWFSCGMFLESLVNGGLIERDEAVLGIIIIFVSDPFE